MENWKKRVLPLLMTAVLLLSALPAGAAGYKDVQSGAWYAKAVAYCTDKGWMKGTDKDTFSPDTKLTRAMMATVLYQMDGSPDAAGANLFSDVKRNTWYYNAVLWASQKKIVEGYGDGTFGTDDPITREQLATFLWRYANKPTAGSTTTFADESGISSFAKTAVHWAQAMGIINGMEDNKFEPRKPATRAQVAQILMNYSSPSAPQGDTVDLKAFAESTLDKYDFPSMGEADAELMEVRYQGLSEITTVQCVGYYAMIGLDAGELTLVQVKNDKDIPAVKDIFQARIDFEIDQEGYMVEKARQWKNNSRIVSEGDYIMLVVCADSDNVVKDFKALF